MADYQSIASKQGDVYIGVQPDAHTPATKFFKPNWVSGSVKVAKNRDEQERLDGNSFSTPFRYIKNIGVAGSLVLQGDAETIARAVAWAVGNETLVAGTGSAQSSRTTELTGNSPGEYLTIIQHVGAPGALKGNRFVGCKIGTVTVEASADNGVVQLTMEVAALKSEVHTAAVADADVTARAEDPFVYTDSRSELLGLGDPDGRVPYIKQWSLSLNRTITPLYGDAVLPYALHIGLGKVELSGALSGNDDSLKALFLYLYGVESPADGTEPTNDLYRNAHVLRLTRVIRDASGDPIEDTRVSVELTLPQVNYEVEDFDPQTDAGEVDIAFTGGAETPANGDPMLTVASQTTSAVASGA